MKGVFLDRATLKPEDLSFNSLNQQLDDWTFFDWTARNEVVERSQDCDVVITNKVLMQREELSQLPNLKLICICATGTNNVDLVAARELSITVCNVSGYAEHSVAQHTMALLLSLASAWHQYDRAVRHGKWSESKMFCMQDYPAFELAGKVLGIVGYGSLGRAVEKMAQALDMNVLIAQPPWKKEVDHTLREPWQSFLSRCDVISLHCPLTTESKHLFNETTIARMKPGSILINTARGGIVNEDALLHALKSGHLRAAALDVLEQEPPSKDHPLIQANLPNLLITPHCAWVSVECRQRLLDAVAQNIASFFKGQAENVVN